MEAEENAEYEEMPEHAVGLIDFQSNQNLNRQLVSGVKWRLLVFVTESNNRVATRNDENWWLYSYPFHSNVELEGYAVH